MGPIICSMTSSLVLWDPASQGPFHVESSTVGAVGHHE